MKTVCDASPLIFLCKVRKLDLLRKVLKGELLLSDDVQRELLSKGIPPAEELLLRDFLETCRVVRLRPRGFKAAALSTADRTVLTLAAREKADCVLADDRILRDLAEVEGYRPLGTLGVLLRAVQSSLLSAEEGKQAVRELVGRHGFRLSVEVYERVLELMDAAG